MWSESFGKEIAHILNLMADKPNLRTDPTGKSTYLFDGGQAIVMTGVTSYEFSDGSSTIYGTELKKELTIRFGPGEVVSEVNIPATDKTAELPPQQNCRHCNKLILVGERYCKWCGEAGCK